MSAAEDIRGLKRVCSGCGTRFYDFNKRPIVCPGCNEEFSGETKVKTRRSRSATLDTEPKTPAHEDHDAVENGAGETELLEDDDDDVVSLDDLDDNDHDDDDNNDVIDPDLENLDDIDDIDDDLDDDDLDDLK